MVRRHKETNVHCIVRQFNEPSFSRASSIQKQQEAKVLASVLQDTAPQFVPLLASSIHEYDDLQPVLQDTTHPRPTIARG